MKAHATANSLNREGANVTCSTVANTLSFWAILYDRCTAEALKDVRLVSQSINGSSTGSRRSWAPANRFHTHTHSHTHKHCSTDADLQANAFVHVPLKQYATWPASTEFKKWEFSLHTALHSRRAGHSAGRALTDRYAPTYECAVWTTLTVEQKKVTPPSQASTSKFHLPCSQMFGLVDYSLEHCASGDLNLPHNFNSELLIIKTTFVCKFTMSILHALL